MLRKKSFYMTILTAFVLMIGIMAIVVATGVARIPDEIYLIGDGSRILDIELPFGITIKSNVENDEESVNAIKINGTSLAEESVYRVNSPIVITSDAEATASVRIDLFGFITVKNVKITAVNEVLLVPGGECIGVMLHTKGALVVGSMDFQSEDGTFVNPAAKAGLKAGDVIEKYNGVEIADAEHLSKLVNTSNEQFDILTVSRDGKPVEIQITPVKDVSDGLYKLGVWVRDSTVGVGTLTYYDPTSDSFAGLGHAITDADTGELLTVKDGTIVKSKIIEIVKGEAGSPGEIRGYFDNTDKVVGRISMNTNYGIYGKADDAIANGLYGAMQAADRSEVVSGAATILCTLDDNGVEEYSCKVVKINVQSAPAQKSFVIQIDDEELLKKTGGIVQGMSGSPILQNGKIIGAVTHVFVDDPTRGYGVYIDWMLNEMYSLG